MEMVIMPDPDTGEKEEVGYVSTWFEDWLKDDEFWENLVDEEKMNRRISESAFKNISPKKESFKEYCERMELSYYLEKESLIKKDAEAKIKLLKEEKMKDLFYWIKYLSIAEMERLEEIIKKQKL